MDSNNEAIKSHLKWRGKIETKVRAEVSTPGDLSIAYTPGVAQPCLAIQQNKELSFSLTRRWNTVAVITDGTAVLGLGDIGPEAGMPVMEGKCALFKAFGDVDAIPLCIRSKNVDEIVTAISLFAGSFGGINLEDIAAPRCFEIERRLKQLCDIPVFHDDQHGTAVVVLAGLENALKLVKKDKAKVQVTISGAGAAGTAIANLLLTAGFKNIVMTNINGIVTRKVHYEDDALNELAHKTNAACLSGGLAEAIQNSDIFVGVSAPDILTPQMIHTMAANPVVFAMANPNPEISPTLAQEAGVNIMATGRSDYPNQINNLLAFPGIFRGALDAQAKDITIEMNLAASRAISALISESELNENYIIPSPFDKRVAPAVAEAVKSAWENRMQPQLL